MGKGRKVWRMGRGRGQTRVELKTVFRRGKSEIPLSRMEIEESSREREERREVTEAVREAAACEAAACEAVILGFVWCDCGERRCCRD